MAKRRSKARRRVNRGPKLPLTIVLPLAGVAVNFVNDSRERGVYEATMLAQRGFTGYDSFSGEWKLKWMKRSALPVLIGAMAHKVATGLGINRALAAARIPYLRI